MRISNQGLVAAMVLSLCSGATLAAEAVNPDKLPRIECSSLRYSEDFLQKYLTAPAACLEARVYKGETWNGSGSEAAIPARSHQWQGSGRL
jgi:hypothetical protein